MSGEAAVVSEEAAVVSEEAAVVSWETAGVWLNAAVACQVIRVTASCATFVLHIASVHSRGACVAFGFARVASRNAACAVGFVTFA